MVTRLKLTIIRLLRYPYLHNMVTSLNHIQTIKIKKHFIKADHFPFFDIVYQKAYSGITNMFIRVQNLINNLASMLTFTDVIYSV